MNVVLEGDPTLFIQYGVMVVNPEKSKIVNLLISIDGQQAIAAFKDSNDNQLFTPNAK
jgi:tungstate transport system substrate-binding protein